MELRAEQLMAIIAALSPQKCAAGRTEKRSKPRIGVRYAVSLRMLDPATGAAMKPVRSWLRSISSCGIGLSCPQCPPLGSRFIVELPRANGANMEMLCVVRNCRQVADDVFQLGASFTAAELLQKHQSVA